MKEYSNKDIKVIWKPEKCIHARECIKGLPQVFSRDKSPWINMQRASTEEIIAVVDRCPSGALTYEKEHPALSASTGTPVARIGVKKNGPLLVKGECTLMDNDGKVLADRGPYALCRCGSSRKKPFCDGTHSKIEFDDAK